MTREATARVIVKRRIQNRMWIVVGQMIRANQSAEAIAFRAARAMSCDKDMAALREEMKINGTESDMDKAIAGWNANNENRVHLEICGRRLAA